MSLKLYQKFNISYIIPLRLYFIKKTLLQYQTGQTYKHIKQFEIKQKSIISGKSAITARFEPQEIVPNLAPDLFGLLQAHLYMKFENDAGILWKRREVQVEVGIFKLFFTSSLRCY